MEDSGASAREGSKAMEMALILQNFTASFGSLEAKTIVSLISLSLVGYFHFQQFSCRLRSRH